MSQPEGRAPATPVLSPAAATPAAVAPATHRRLLAAARRRFLSTLSSYRLRLLVWFVVLLALGTTATVAVLGEVLVQGIDERIRRDLVQETDEVRQLAAGNDPETGEPFGDDVRRIFDVFLERNIPARNEVFVTFLDGEVYRRSVPAPRYPLERDTEFVRQTATVSAPRTGRLITPVGAVEYLAVPMLLGGETQGVFAVAAFRDAERAEQDDLIRAAGSVGLVLLVIGSLLAWRLADRVLAPVRRTAATARSISETDLTRRVDVRGHDEVAELARTFNEMLDRVSSAFDSQRRFLDDVGHELRTPLTIVQGHLELLEEGSADERERALAVVLDELERMTRLVNDLLLLAAASRPDFVRRGTLDSGDLARSIHEKATVLAERAWRLEVGRAGPFSGDRQRLTQAMLQLVANAVQHTHPGDEIAIGSELEDDVVRLWVRDTGSGIDPADHEAIFQRFYHVDGSGRGGGSGTGLGLSIVRAIAEAHGGRAEVISARGSGATFVLVVPRTRGADGAVVARDTGSRR